MLTKRKVKIPIFNYLMYVYVYDYWENLKGNIANNIYTQPNTNGLTIEYEDYCIVCCPANTNKVGVVLHESGHVKNLVWKYIGYTPQRDNDEVDQYLHQYIFEEINKIINKHLTK